MKICSKSRNTALYPLNKEEYGRFSQKNEVLIFRIKKETGFSHRFRKTEDST